MIHFGEPPYLECSSVGDARFSAFYARPKSLRGKCIEEAYQSMKEFPGGYKPTQWKHAKGRRALNGEQCLAAYARWWKEWVDQQGLLDVLKAASGLSDVFGQRGHACQAEVLWRIRNEGSLDLSQGTLW